MMTVAGSLFEAQAQVQARMEAPPVQAAGLKQVGAALLKVFGFEVYQARLWAEPGFQPDRYEQYRLALELAYLRNLDGAAIAQRSLKEMQRLEPLNEAQGRQWLAEMTRLFPDVRKGDRITGAYQPGRGVSFQLNDRLLGEVNDPAFARLFMGIWLSPRTSEPEMRRQLTGNAGP